MSNKLCIFKKLVIIYACDVRCRGNFVRKQVIS